jgi:hypothetical protein
MRVTHKPHTNVGYAVNKAGEQMRDCTKCGKMKPFSEFGKTKYIKSGVTSRCRECINEYKISYYTTNKEKLCQQQRERYSMDKVLSNPPIEKPKISTVDTTEKYKQCNNCNILKNVSSFHNYKLSPDGLTHKCKSCCQERGGDVRRFKKITETKVPEKQCRKCLTNKPFSNFRKNGRTKDGYEYNCTSCAKSRAYKDRNDTKQNKSFLSTILGWFK